MMASGTAELSASGGLPCPSAVVGYLAQPSCHMSIESVAGPNFIQEMSSKPSLTNRLMSITISYQWVMTVGDCPEAVYSDPRE